MKSSLISVDDLEFQYSKGFGQPILKKVSFSIAKGEFIVLTGPSGSGKSTLFYLLGLMLRRYSGNIWLEDRELKTLSEEELAELRNKNIGFVFQQFHLLSGETVRDNILLPLHYPYPYSQPGDQDYKRAESIAKELNILDIMDRSPDQLSGGQQQRVAIARALINRPKILLADEPTGNLDSEATDDVISVFRKLHQEGLTVVMITHDQSLTRHASRVISFKDGEILSDTQPLKMSSFVEPFEKRKNKNKKSFSWISFFFSSIQPAWTNLRRTKRKAIATMLGVILGIAAVLTTLSLGQYAKNRIMESYTALGVNNLNLLGWQNWRRSASEGSFANFEEFHEDDVIRPMLNLFPQILSYSPVLNSRNFSIHFGDRVLSDEIELLGVNEKFTSINRLFIEEGRGFSYMDIHSPNGVCILGQSVYRDLFPQGVAKNKIVRLVLDGQSFEHPCRVVGIIESKGGRTEGIPPDRTVLIPWPFFQQVINSSWGSRIHYLRLQIDTRFEAEVVGNQLVGFLNSRYGDTGNFRYSSNSEMIAQMGLFLTVFSFLLTAVALVSLVVGGVGIHNMMLVGLNERVRELGLRKALGASSRTLKWQILTESLLVCGVAGVIGVLLGVWGYHILIYGASKLIEDVAFEWVFLPSSFLFAFCAILCTGILSGLVPSRVAERLEVIEALRQSD